MSEIKEVSAESTVNEKCGQLVDDLIGSEHPIDLRKKLRLMWDRYAMSETTTEERTEVYEAYQIIDKALMAMEEMAM